MSPTNSTCDLAQDMRTYVPFILVLCNHSILGFISIFLCIKQGYRMHFTYFHINCKILIYFLLFSCVFHAMFHGTIQTYTLLRFLLASHSCDVPVTSLLCLAFRVPASISINLNVFFQFSLMIERAYATWSRNNYEKQCPILSIVLVCFSCCTSSAITLWMAAPEPFDLYYPYCTAATAQTAARTNIAIYIMSLVMFPTIIAILIVWQINLRAKRKKDFTLRLTFQVTENLTVIRLLMPIFIFTSLFYIFFILTNYLWANYFNYLPFTIFRTVYAGIYLLPFYTVGCPLVLAKVVARSQALRRDKIENLERKEKDAPEHYFKAYEAMWNIEPGTGSSIAAGREHSKQSTRHS